MAKKLPERSFFSLVLYLIYLGVKVPVSRIFGRALVKGWSIRTEIGVLFIKRMINNSLQAARKAEEITVKLANGSLPEPIVVVEQANFRGHFIGQVLDTPDILIVYAHGGGYSLCNSLTYAASLCELVRIMRVEHHLKLKVLAVDYTRAPEAKYPHQRNECIEALDYVSKLDPGKPVFLFGDSAGGNLVLTMPLALKDQKPELLRLINGVVAVSPWVNLRNPCPESELHEKHDYVSSSDLENHLERFLPSDCDLKDPKLSPSEIENFEGFPNLFIHYGGMEVFKTDIELFLEKAKSKGCAVQSMKEDLAPHITPMLIPFFPDYADKGLHAIAIFIKEHLS